MKIHTRGSATRVPTGRGSVGPSTSTAVISGARATITFSITCRAVSADASRGRVIVPPSRRGSLLGAERRHVPHLEQLAAAVVHVDAARQARVEAAHRAHDVDTLELVRPVLLEERRVLHGVLVRPR